MSGSLRLRLIETGGRLAVRAAPPAPAPLGALLAGRGAAEVAALLPRLFAVCAAAQGQAVRLALGLPLLPAADLRREIAREHLVKLCVAWPRALGLAPRPFPAGWERGASAALWGGARPGRLAGWLAAGRGAAPVLAGLAARFAPGEAAANLPPLSDPFGPGAQENSAAGRCAGDPLMAEAEAAFGRGPLWRALSRIVDLERVETRGAAARAAGPGAAVVEAARGACALRLEMEGGRLAGLLRRTPTDHLCAPGGALERALAALPAAKRALAPLVVDLLDPCCAVEWREPCDA